MTHAKALVLLCAALLVVLCRPAVAAEKAGPRVPPGTTDARVIMTAVERQDRGDRTTSRMQMKVDSQAGGKRERLLQVRGLNFAGGVKQLLLFEAPADVRNIGLLTIDYDAGERSDDQWLYLPNLHRSSRISTADRSNSFMGTDLSYADMTRKDPGQYEYRLLSPGVRVGPEECWHIEARPVTPKEQKETGYSKIEVWISKSMLMPVQSKAYGADGKRVKYIQYRGHKQIDGFWVAHEIIARTVEGSAAISTTAIGLSDVKFGAAEVTEADFTQARLEKGL